MSQLNTIVQDHSKPEILLQKLIRFNTVNPPGNESECIRFIYSILKQAGIEVVILGKKPERLNLVARLKGQGVKPPLLMYGHADVVTAQYQEWYYPPFGGIINNDCVWGRGALDMKGALAMMICSILRAKSEGYVPLGDIILCIVGDEEDSGAYGAKYIVENHAYLFDNVHYAIGEIGGFSMKIAGKKFYPIMVSEKQRCGIKCTISGHGGHGSLPIRNDAMAKLGGLLTVLNKKRLPVHITPAVKMMIEALAANISFPTDIMIKGLLNPLLADRILDIMGYKGRVFEAVLHNTVNGTIVQGGDKINVIPGQIELCLDGRILPGIDLEEFLEELHHIIGKDIKYEVLFFEKGPDKIDMGLFHTLSHILREEDDEGISIPFVVSGVTDARFFAGLGIQTYGFTPMILPDDIDFSRLIHSANERIPIAALKFGTESIYKLIKRYGYE